MKGPGQLFLSWLNRILCVLLNRNNMKRNKQLNRPSSKAKRNRERRQNIVTISMVILLFGGWFGWLSYNIYQQERHDSIIRENLKSMPAPGVSIEPKMVCMVNNMYMGIDQIPVAIQDKIYYGCCDQCVRDLTTNETVRYAVDPYSNVRVDKSRAFITMDPRKRGAILYFESEENARKYISKR